MNNMTELKMFKHYRKNEEIPAIRVNDNTILVHETADIPMDGTLLRAAEFVPYLTGPIADRLYAFEQFGLEPEEIMNGMQRDHDLIAKLRKENAELRAELARTTCDLQDAEERNNVKDAHIDNLRVEIDGLRNTVNAKDALIRKLVAENLALKTTEYIKDDFMRACTVRHIDTFELDTKKLSKENDKLNAEISELRSEVKRRMDQIGRQAETISHKRKENEKLLDKNGSLAKRIGELEKERDGYIKRFKEYEDLYIKSDKLVEEFGKELEDMRAELDHRDKQNEELFKENKDLESKLTKAEATRDAYFNRLVECGRIKDKYEHSLKLIQKYDIIIQTIEKIFDCEFDI